VSLLSAPHASSQSTLPVPPMCARPTAGHRPSPRKPLCYHCLLQPPTPPFQEDLPRSTPKAPPSLPNHATQPSQACCRLSNHDARPSSSPNVVLDLSSADLHTRPSCGCAWWPLCLAQLHLYFLHALGQAFGPMRSPVVLPLVSFFSCKMFH
jgi:hypothetical protein